MLFGAPLANAGTSGDDVVMHCGYFLFGRTGKSAIWLSLVIWPNMEMQCSQHVCSLIPSKCCTHIPHIHVPPIHNPFTCNRSEKATWHKFCGPIPFSAGLDMGRFLGLLHLRMSWYAAGLC